MSRRLQVIMEDAEFRQIQQAARRHKMTVAEWVRQALRAARRQAPASDRVHKLEAIREAARHRFPAGPVEEMLEEIERGYLGGAPK